jgi:FkbM family methyltransferase
MLEDWYRMDQTPLVSDLVYDVGMHLGEDSAYYLKKGFRVVGFEGNPNLVAACRSRFAREIVEGRLKIVAGAISKDTDTETTTFYVHSVTTWGTTEADWVERNLPHGESRAIVVPTVKFEDELRASGIPYYMKVDIEGADRLCFEALAQFVNRPTYVSLESEKNDFGALLAELDLLERLGYDRFAAVQQEYIERRPITTRDLAGRPFAHTFEAAASGPFGEDLEAPWEDREGIVAQYRRIFRRYRFLGDAWLRRTRVTRKLTQEISRLTGRPMPGWYDTHAKHGVGGLADSEGSPEGIRA